MSSHTARILSEHFSGSNGTLVINGQPLERLIAKYGTPLFIYCGGVARTRLQALRSALRDFDVFYAVKANPHAGWLKFFVREGCGLSVATVGELEGSLQAGCPARRIILAGAGKTEKELQAAVRVRVCEIHVESISELLALEQIASCHNVYVRTVLRLNAGEITRRRDGTFEVQEKPAAYGFDEENIGDAIRQFTRCEHLMLHGIHTYFGTQHLESRGLLSAYWRTLDLAERVSGEAGIPLRTIDFGGGFGVPYYPEERSFDIADFASQLRPLLDRLGRDGRLKSATLCIEPGRFLVGEAGLYVTRVIGVKTSYGRKFVTVDGGMHHHFAATGRLAGPVRRNFPVVVGNRLGEEENDIVSIVGRQCTALDTLARDVALPNVVVGDPLIFLQSGAYTLSASPQSFRSHPKAAEILLE